MELLEMLLNNYAFASFAVIAAIVFSLICSIRVKSVFSKYNRMQTLSNVRACDAARQILDANGLYDVAITRVSGDLTDHYDPKNNIIALSDSVYDSTAVGAIGVAAHECGHAIQYARSYVPIMLRNSIYPLVSFCSKTWVWVFMLGCALGIFFMAEVAIVFFAVVVLFQLVTLPVEFDASGRAMKTLESTGILFGGELKGARKVLTAAAMTYIAALLVSLMQLFRLIAGTRRRN
ncbi:MAG: zinc metallopeptidase [Bacteroides sp.]|nr:zinc metallopeptidase [Eubacterium sp.]MCM1417946.1 zinc metallopeptidase [Roseburia sp.]MCM1461807.1 zinc metallopeptidase [Bacteroides sp.]